MKSGVVKPTNWNIHGFSTLQSGHVEIDGQFLIYFTEIKPPFAWVEHEIKGVTVNSPVLIISLIFNCNNKIILSVLKSSLLINLILDQCKPLI